MAEELDPDVGGDAPRRRRKERKVEMEDAEVNMTPMIDIVFQLIIFFMLVSTFSEIEADRDITLPLASEAKEQEIDSSRLLINVRMGGEITVGGQTINERQLISQLGQASKANWNDAENVSETEIIIRADGRGPWENPQMVFWHAQKLGIYKIKLVAAPVK